MFSEHREHGGLTSRGVREKRSTGLGSHAWLSSHSTVARCPSAAARCLHQGAPSALWGLSNESMHAKASPQECCIPFWFLLGLVMSPACAIASETAERTTPGACKQVAYVKPGIDAASKVTINFGGRLRAHKGVRLS